MNLMRSHDGDHSKVTVSSLTVTVLVVAVATSIRFFVEKFIRVPFPFVTSSFAVIFCAWYGGIKHGLIAMALSLVLLNYLFIDPKYHFVALNRQSAIEMAVYLVLGVLSAWLVELQQKSRREADKAAAAAREETNQRKLAEDSLRKAQAELQCYAITLEKRIQERTEQLEKSLKFLDSFLYSMAHELRGPIRALKGLSEALCEDYQDRLDATGADYCNRMSRASERLDSLVSDLLNYGKFGHLDLPLERVDLNLILRETVDDLNASRFIVLPNMLPIVLAHRTAVNLVFTNLISNALKFIPEERTPSITITSEDRADWIRISVSDNGIGMDPKYFSRIFEPFQRLHSLDSFPGTGIGLALVKLAMERVGGEVGVHSEPGRGSRFWLDFRKS